MKRKNNIPEHLKAKYSYYFMQFEYVSYENNKLYFYDFRKEIAESIIDGSMELNEVLTEISKEN